MAEEIVLISKRQKTEPYIQENTRNGHYDANFMLACYSFSISHIMNPIEFRKAA